MRVLWVCNMMPAAIAERIGIPYSNKEGWVSALCERILQEEQLHNQGAEGLVLGVCFPWEGIDGVREGSLEEKLYYYGFSEDTVHEERYDEDLEVRLKEIITAFAPDMMHCFGTEYGHTLAALRAYDNPSKSLIGLQGICYEIAEHYLDGVPESIVHRSTPRDFLKADNLAKQKEKMQLRGEREKECFRLAGHVTGRTEFDKRSVHAVHPEAVYHFMNETLRAPFYDGSWSLGACERYSIFVSQGNYPVKGLHYVLDALPILVRDYPGIHLYIAGDNITKTKMIDKLKISTYALYLTEQIRQGNLEKHVTFLGPLSAQEMKERMLKSHVFLSASTIENSPNSVGEAMLLGVPVVASEVGGVPDMVTDGVSGLCYTKDKQGAMASAIVRIFEDPDQAEQLSERAKRQARQRHDADANYHRLLEIYGEIYEL